MSSSVPQEEPSVPQRDAGSEPDAQAGRVGSGADAPLEENRALLEQVLRRTMLGDSTSDDDPALRAALVDVARRRGGGALDEAVVEQLVEAALRVRFPSLAQHAAAWSRIKAQVAGSLWDDRIIRDRLEALWTDLAGR